MFVTAIVCMSLSACEVRRVNVYDGDTFTVGQQSVRIRSINAPEIKGYKCKAERALAYMARGELARLLKNGRVTIAVTGIDKYGRSLATVRADGIDVGAALLKKGLARKWSQKWNHDPEPWCL